MRAYLAVMDAALPHLRSGACAAWVVLILVMLAAPALAADTAGLSLPQWERVRAAQSATIDLKPTPSPQAPAKVNLRECLTLAFRHNAGFRQNQEQLINVRRSLWVADQRLFYTATGNAEREQSPGASAETALTSSLATRWEATDGGAVQASVGTGTQETFGDLLTQRPALSLSYDRPLLRGVGLASSTAERIRSARIALSTQELSFYDAHQDLAQRVIEDYFAVLLARGEVDIAQRAVERAKQLYDINYAKFSGEGLKKPGEEWVSQVAEIDVDQARLSWERSKQQLISRQQAYRDAVDRLLLDMGFVPGGTPDLTTAIT